MNSKDPYNHWIPKGKLGKSAGFHQILWTSSGNDASMPAISADAI
jgi:hypothetical protein